MTSPLQQRLENLIAPVVAGIGLELVEVQFRTEGHGWVLRVVIDEPNGVNLTHCERVSREVSALLDVEEVVPHAFHLEVSSPGLDRPLKTRRDFERCLGRLVTVHCAEPIGERLEWEGRLREVSDNEITLEVAKKQVAIPLAAVQKARQAIEF